MLLYVNVASAGVALAGSLWLLPKLPGVRGAPIPAGSALLGAAGLVYRAARPPTPAGPMPACLLPSSRG